MKYEVGQVWEYDGTREATTATIDKVVDDRLWATLRDSNGEIVTENYWIFFYTAKTVFTKRYSGEIKIKNKPTKKENEMKRVSVLLINKDTDAVIFNEEMATEFSDADLKVLILLDKGAEIKKSLGKEINVTLLHWEIKTITSYDKPEVK